MFDPEQQGPASHPRLMAVLNASPDSFSGGVVDAVSVGDQAVRAVRDGATLLDIGGQSLRTDRPEITVAEELARVLPTIDACRAAVAEAPGRERVGISIDTYRAEVAREAVAAGATVINDPSGLLDPSMAELAAETGVALVLAYSRATPKVRIQREELVADPVADGLSFLAEKVATLAAAGVASEQLLVDPGPDLGKSPAQTIAVLRALTRFREFGAPLLLALSRKDFIGAVTRTDPSARAGGLDGVMAALDLGPNDVLRVHEPARVRDFYVMRAVMRGEVDVADDLVLPDDLRYVTPS